MKTRTAVLITIFSLILYTTGNSADDSVDDLIRQTYALLNKDKVEYLKEAEGEELGDLLQALIKTNDPRIAPILLDVMVSEKVGGRMIAEGLWKLGSATISAVMDSLDSPRLYSRVSASATLATIAEMDSTETVFSEQERRKILNKSIALLKILEEDEKNVHLKGKLIRTLGIFGDSSTIPLLETIEGNDTYATPTGIYFHRRMASRAIETIRKKQTK